MLLSRHMEMDGSYHAGGGRGSTGDRAQTAAGAGQVLGLVVAGRQEGVRHAGRLAHRAGGEGGAEAGCSHGGNRVD